MSSVPVAQYEALRAEMRSLVQQTQQVQEIATQVISIYSNSSISSTNHQIRQDEIENSIKPQPDFKMESLVLDNVQLKKNPNNINNDGKIVEGETIASEDECGRVPSTTQMSVSSEPISQQSRPMNALYHGTWPVERTMWNSEPNNLNPQQQQNNLKHNMDQQSVLSFASSSGGAPLDRVLGSPEQLSRKSMQQFEAKVDMVYSLLAMLGGQEHADMGDTLLALSTSPESCLAMRQSGCIPLLVQLVQSDKDLDTRKKASQALHNLVHAQTDERLRKRETRVLKLLEQARKYTEALKNNTEYEPDVSSSSENQENSDQNDKHPVLVIANLMKHSFDEGHRQAICQLGGIHIIASLVEIEHALHGSVMDSASCILLRRYACMALTNLTFGDSGNKALLCSFREFMRALVIQLQSPSDELRQVTASVLRNLSWRADPTSKEILREVGTVTGLMKAGMATGKENTLKSILSALWNLSAHCTENKLEICAVEGGLGFLVDMLSYKAPSKSLSINENAGGILRNISSQIAVRDDYREILRKFNCLQILLEQLKSPSLTIVSNACGTLWNLSAKNQVDQEALWQMGAPAMLRSLNHSKHKMIATGSSAALKNLLNSRPSHSLLPQMDSTARAMDLPVLPTLGARKQKALMRDLDQNLSETFENIERDSPTKLSRDEKLLFERTEKFSGSFLNKRTRSSKNVVRSESHEFVSHNDLVYESRTTRSEASNQGELCNGFASLNLNEPSTSYQKELRNSSGGRISGQYSGSSLVYVNQAQRKGTYIPLRNNYSDEYPDDIDSTEQPIDYSRKYSETKLATAPKAQFVPTPTTKEPKKEESSKPLRKDSNYGIYAETDLDQPTDYSLRYAEDDSDDEDICDKIRQKDGNEFGIQDTLKTYCTEGTPYETPLNFSNATSMSDLRIDAEKTDIDNDKNKDKDNKVAIPTLSHLDEKDHCSVEDISEIDNTRKPAEKPPKSELSSGLMSPEKPVNYCEEGTPGYFSRVSSFGSLNSIPVNETEKTQQVEVVSSEVAKNVEEKVDASPTEAKAVKFLEPTVNYAEQTPLMFSRSSSLASLDSVEQHSIHDDRSSVVSDFSRLTSGIVSPSELPDSPTQTVPPSPRPRKGLLEYPSTSRNGTGNFLRGPDGRPQPAPRTLHKPSVFEDNITKFKEESTPIQFSTATSISSLTIDDQDEPVCGDLKNATPSESCNGTSSAPGEEGVEKQDTEQEKRDSSSEFIEQLSENDEDDDILADCINIGMQNNRHRQSKSSSPPTSKIPAFKSSQRPPGSGIPLPRKGIPTRCSFPQQTQRPKPTPMHSDTVRTYCTEDTPAVLSQAGSNSDLSVLSIQTDNKSKKDYLSDDSSNLSGDNDNILAECIQSGMPKAKVAKEAPAPKRQIPSRKLQTSTPIKPFTRNEHFEDKKRFASGYLAAKDEVASFAVENSPCQFSLRSSLSDLTVDGSVAGLTRTVGEGETTAQGGNLKPGPSLHNTGSESLISRQESLSSLSVESFGSMETEQALLEQCISSGMPKSKNATCAKPAEKEKPIGVATKQFNAQKTLEMELCRRQEENGKSSKNASAASVAGNIKPIRAKSPEIPATATDVDTANQKIGLALKIKTDHHGTGRNQPMKTIDREIKTDTSPDKLSPTDANSSTDPTKNGSESKTLDCALSSSTCSNSDNCQNISDIKNVVDNRMLDPEAMIESLDRFTAELVSQASSHLQNKEENKFVTSVTEGDTWNDDTSPNDVTFPSISGSPPNVITFSDSSPQQKPTDELDGLKSNDFSSSTLTESTLIAMEATKMATTFQQEAELSLSVASLELDQVQPPSQMNSLTSSAFESVRKSPKLVTRKRSLPVGLMVKRALNNSLCQGSSLESLENNSLSNLDHINPPSAMADLLDMEGSMVSVASLSSEIADFQINGKVTEKFQQPNPIFNVKQPANMLHLLTHSSNVSITDNLENVNPPSIFNEITDMCNSLADVETENIDTELFEDCNTNVPTDNDATEMYSDANSMTPIQSDLSSSETTPKKVKTLSRQLTPKQKRILLKERYKTYTVAAEMMRGEQDKLMDSKEDDTETEDFKTVACHTESYKTVENYSTATYTRSPSKSTPKERRQNDPARFQTQVLDKAVTELLLEASPPNSDSNNSNNNSPQQSPARSRISIRRNFTQKRLENKDRFKTQTITEASLSPSPSPTDLHYLVQKEANMVLKTLSETKSKPDDFLDCETISLVSNEDDSEHNSGSSTCRTVPKSLSNGPAIPVVQQTIPSRISSESNTAEEDIETEEQKPVNINYGTYHKSWSNGPKVESNLRISSDLENYQPEDDFANSESEEEEEEKPLGKPKIIKPSEKVKVIEEVASEEGKGIRGRRKPLYSKANTNNKMAGKSLKPIKSVTSNLVKNVSSSLKSSVNIKVVGKPPTVAPAKGLKPPTNYSKPKSSSNSPKGSPVRTVNNKSPKHTAEPNKPKPVLERQGTFTKEDKTPKSKIPSAIPKTTSRIAKAIPVKTPSKIQTYTPTNRTGLVKSASTDRANKPSQTRLQNRSPSADSRAQKTTPSLPQKDKKHNNNPSSKQITSRIASLWKKVEESKKQPTKKDTRVWIQNEENLETTTSEDGRPLVRSNTFEGKPEVILRTRPTDEVDETKRVSRLGSFLVVDEDDINGYNYDSPELSF